MGKPTGHGGSSGVVGGFTTITGNGQDNRLMGTDGANYIDGRSGNDYLHGCGGNDTLTGGSGFDQFALKSGGGQDVITDWQAGEDIFFTFGYVLNNPGDPVHDGSPHALSAGETFTTSQGHVLTVGVDARGDTTLTWDTGDSLTLTGVSPDEISSAALCFYPSDLGWNF
jgi:serralysin